MAEPITISSPLQAVAVSRAACYAALQPDTTLIKRRVPSNSDGKHKDAQCQREEKRVGARLVDFEDAPEYMKDNKYILSGYRVDHSAWQCAKSIFALHNETGNIWTHLVGFFVLLGAGIYTTMILLSLASEGNFSSISKARATGEKIFNEGKTMMHKLAEGDVVAVGVDDVLSVGVSTAFDIALFAVYHLAAMFCMAASTIYHTSIGHSRAAMECCLKFDLSGIGVLVTASCYAPVYYGLSCSTWRWVYIVVQTLFCAGGIIGPQYPLFNSTRFRHIRALLYGGMALFGVVPITHMYFALPFPAFVDVITGILQMYAAYAVGLVFYITRYPEKLFPGLCDTWFHSHQFWHCFVLLGALIHSNTCWTTFKIAQSLTCSA